jgi:hypothetical protein
MRRQQLLFDAADRQDLAAQGNFAGHRHVAADGDSGQDGNQRR